jgi:hypothetical protein
MSQFFDQYNSILEKSLQKVRLRVDPNVKYAEDFAQYDGYVGYILAETDESIDFFYENNTVTLPKNAVIIEQENTGMRRFMQSAVGNAQGGVSGALGTMVNKGVGLGVGLAGNALKGAANLGSMLYTGQQLFPAGANQNQQPNAAAGAKPVPAAANPNIKPLPNTINRSNTYPISDITGTKFFGGGNVAVINFGNNKLYVITAIQVNSSGFVLVPESFDDILHTQYGYLTLEAAVQTTAAMQGTSAPTTITGAGQIQPAPVTQAARAAQIRQQYNTQPNIASNQPINAAVTAPGAKPLTTQKINSEGAKIFNNLCTVSLLDYDYGNLATGTNKQQTQAPPVLYQDVGFFSKSGNSIVYMPAQLQK